MECSAHIDCTFVLNILRGTVLTYRIDVTPWLGGGARADYYRKRNLVQKRYTSFWKSTEGLGNPPQANFHNYYFSKGIRTGRTLLHWQMGEVKSGLVSTCS